MSAEELEILNKVQRGELTAEEGARLLEALEASALIPHDVTEQLSEQPALEAAAIGAGPASLPQVSSFPEQDDYPPNLGWWKKAWLIPFWLGTAVLVAGAVGMGWAYSARHFFWFYCSWLPMLLGMLVLFLSWWSQQARWVHVRVKDADGTQFAISMPLPLGLAGWALRVFGRFIPNMDNKVLDELPDILASLSKEKGPTTVEVDDDDGSKVRVYIL